MSIAAIATAINAKITAALAPEPPPTFGMGMDDLFKEEAPPRIVYVPGTEKIGPPQARGGDGVKSPRALFSREVQVAVHLWGADVSATEELLVMMTRAFQAEMFGSYAMRSGVWNPEGSTSNKAGELLVVQMIWGIPITDAPELFATLSTMPIIPAIEP